MREDLKPFFKHDHEKDECLFIGDKLTIKIPRRYANYDLLTVGEQVHTLGIFEMIINDSLFSGFCIPAVIIIEPTDINIQTIDNVEYVILTLYKNDKFLVDTKVIRNPNLGYSIFLEFIALGNFPKFITYNEESFLFDKVSDICKINFKVNHSVWEILTAHLNRDSEDITKFYRFSTDKSKPPIRIELRSVSFAPESTSSKIFGSYMNDGMSSALVNQSDKHYDIEDLLRL